MSDSKTPHSEFPVPHSSSPVPRSEFRIPSSRVLLVDDEESIRITLSEFIKDKKYVIETAADATEALRLMDKHAFDVVVTDIVLPRMNGVALMKKIRERAPDTQVIMLTGDPTVETAAEAVRAGAFDYLTKPVSKNAIRRVVANAAYVKALTDEKRQLEEANRWYQNHLEELVEKRTTALMASEKRYRVLFTSIADPIFIFDKETNRFLGCNQSVLNRYGYTMDELFSITPQHLHPSEEVERVIANIDDEEDLSTHRYTHVTKGGEQFPVEIHTAALEYRGKEAWISIVRDITKQVRAENALRESELRYRGIVQYQTECIDRWLPDGTVTFVNDAYCRYFGGSCNEFIGNDWLRTVAQEDREQMRVYAESLKTKLTPENPVSTSEHQEVRADGKIRWMQWSDQAIFDKQGDLVEFQSVGRDITVQKQAEEALKDHYVNLAETMARTFNLRNPYTAEHQLGTARLIRLVGEKMGWEEGRIQNLYIGTLLHDIGKVAIPEAILRKPGKLTKEEWAFVQTHPQRGYELLNEANLPWPVAELAHHHHERLDGSGYPDGLKGDQLCEEVRILAVCNVVDAMSRPHPHRLARSKEEIVDELKRGKGGEYDSMVVSILLEMIERGEWEAGK